MALSSPRAGVQRSEREREREREERLTVREEESIQDGGCHNLQMKSGSDTIISTVSH